MTRLSELFPEIYRYRAQEAGYIKLISGFCAALALCLAAAWSIAHTTGSWKDYLSVITYMQFDMLVFYGALCTAKSVTQERAGRTWDFQRLTPLSSFRLAAGKFMGAPVFAWFLFACLLPAALITAVLAPEADWTFFSRYATGTSCALLFIAAGLLASAYDDTGGSGMGHLSGPLTGIVGVVFLNAAFRYLNSWAGPYAEPLSFYGWEMGEVSGALFITAGFLAFAAWAFLGARCRIGRDLLERRRLWRLPAFLFFLAWFVSGTGYSEAARSSGVLVSAVLLPGLTAYMAAFLSRERSEYWRRWLAGAGRARRLDDAPAWLKGAASVLVIGACLWLVNFYFANPVERQNGRLLLILPLFLLRDLFFLQWCRFSKSRRPEMMALAYIALAYALPLIILAPAGLRGLLPVFVPYAPAGVGAAANLAGPVAQVLAMGYIFYRKTKAVLAGNN